MAEDGTYYIDTGDFRIKVPDDLKSKYADSVGKEVVFGIRPEDIHAPDLAPPNITAAPFSATVEVIELLGHESHLFMTTGKNSVVAIVDNRFIVSVGNHVDLVMNVANMHLFDKQTNLAIR